MRDEDDSPYLSQDEELENENFSNAVDSENNCCEVDISHESHVNCDTINVSMIISKVKKIVRFFSQISFEESNFIIISSRGAWKKCTVDVGFQN